MSKFETNVCPLCSKVLKFHKIAGVNVYSCPSKLEAIGFTDQSHYEVEYDKQDSIQHIYVLPFGIDNSSANYRSRIYKAGEAGRKWGFVKEVPRVTATSEDMIRTKLDTLML
jgi:hypothetical protein